MKPAVAVVSEPVAEEPVLEPAVSPSDIASISTGGSGGAGTGNNEVQTTSESSSQKQETESSSQKQETESSSQKQENENLKSSSRRGNNMFVLSVLLLLLVEKGVPDA